MDTKQSKQIKKCGFTLAEIVTTVAIIGILSAIAVPNFMRIRMDVNMEMVRQTLRVAGEKLTEIMGKQGRFPSNDEIGAGAAGEDEISLTATLSSIDGKGYTRDYVTDENFSFAMIRSDPIRSPGGGITGTGDKCFLWDPTENVREIACWSAQGMDLVNVGLTRELIARGLRNPLPHLLGADISDQDKAKIIAVSFERAAYELAWPPDYIKRILEANPPEPGAILAYQLYHFSDPSEAAVFKALLPQVEQILESKGIHMFFDDSPNSYPQVGFKIDKPITNQEDYSARIESVGGITMRDFYNATSDRKEDSFFNMSELLSNLTRAYYG